MPGRLQEWRDLVTHVVDRAAIDGGTRLQLDSPTPLGQLALLVGAEQRCCSFFAFAITVDSRGIALEVRGPPEVQVMVESVFDGATVRCVRIGIILFDGFDELDAIGPYEVFRHAAKLGADIDAQLMTLGDVDEVTASGGLHVRPHRHLGEAPDMVVVPGGGWNDRASRGAWSEVQRGELTRVLGELHEAGTVIATVCTGGMIAAAAGLTKREAEYNPSHRVR